MEEVRAACRRTNIAALPNMLWSVLDETIAITAFDYAKFLHEFLSNDKTGRCKQWKAKSRLSRILIARWMQRKI